MVLSSNSTLPNFLLQSPLISINDIRTNPPAYLLVHAARNHSNNISVNSSVTDVREKREREREDDLETDVAKSHEVPCLCRSLIRKSHPLLRLHNLSLSPIRQPVKNDAMEFCFDLENRRAALLSN